MFCMKCGHKCPDNATFCSQCGARCTTAASTPAATAAAPVVSQPVVATTAATTVTLQEYFANHCSKAAKKRRTVIKLLSYASLVIQGILAILSTITLLVVFYGAKQNILFKDPAGIVLFPLVILIPFTVCFFTFTLLAIKKYSTGLFVAATIFAFFATTFAAGYAISDLNLRRAVIIVITVIYIVLTCLNSQNNKEYKKYLLGNRS